MVFTIYITRANFNNKELSNIEKKDQKPKKRLGRNLNIQLTGKEVKWHLNIFKDANSHSQ